MAHISKSETRWIPRLQFDWPPTYLSISPDHFILEPKNYFASQSKRQNNCRPKTAEGDLGIPGGRDCLLSFPLLLGIPLIASGGILLANNHNGWGGALLGTGIVIGLGGSIALKVIADENCD